MGVGGADVVGRGGEGCPLVWLVPVPLVTFLEEEIVLLSLGTCTAGAALCVPLMAWHSRKTYKGVATASVYII